MCVCVCVCVVVVWVRRVQTTNKNEVRGGFRRRGLGIRERRDGVFGRRDALRGGLQSDAHKIDPYINVDAGTMSPFEHGETYVLDDEGESDLDLGNYERFCDINLTRDHNITTGKVYQSVIEREREGSI